MNKKFFGLITVIASASVLAASCAYAHPKIKISASGTENKAAAEKTLNAYSVPKALCVPLDDRPSCRLFPAQIARIGGAQLIQPQRTWLGRAYTPGNTSKLISWLSDQPAASNALISSDMLAYGGLIASRTSAASESQALENLQILKSMHDKGQAIEILSVSPRLSLRTSDKEAPYEQALRNWAASGRTDPPEKVPQEIFSEYMQVRQRNINVIMHLISLTAEGVIDHLVIGQDDSAPKGIHISEIQALRDKIKELGIEDKAQIVCGADELMCNMTAGWLSRVHNYSPRLEIQYSDPEYQDKIPPLESLTLAQTAKIHMDLSGAVPAENTGTLIFAQTPSDKPYAVPEINGTDETRALADELLQKIESVRSSQKGRPYGIADLRLVNRAEPIFAQKVIENVPIWELSTYSAWNTPSNSLGTAIAQACAQQIAIAKGWKWDNYTRLESEKTQQAFTAARLIDDYAYQAVIRQDLSKEYKNINIHSDPLLNESGPAGTSARASAIPWAKNLWEEKLSHKSYYSRIVGKYVYFADMKLEITLPWPRLFEIEERLDLTIIPKDEK